MCGTCTLHFAPGLSFSVIILKLTCLIVKGSHLWWATAYSGSLPFNYYLQLIIVIYMVNRLSLHCKLSVTEMVMVGFTHGLSWVELFSVLAGWIRLRYVKSIVSIYAQIKQITR